MEFASQDTAFPISALKVRSSLNLFLTCPRLPQPNYGFRAHSRSNMNKAGLVDRIAASAGVSKTQATAMIEALIDSISSAIKKGERVTLVGFGTFAISHHKARNGRNPQTGDSITLPARRAARFSPSLKLKKVVNRK
jgi:DNA-binding protein HU-beta